MPLPSPNRAPRASLSPEQSALATSRQEPQEAARAAALQKVCDSFRTTISPRSAARLADLLDITTYEQAA